MAFPRGIRQHSRVQRELRPCFIKPSRAEVGNAIIPSYQRDV